MHISRDEIYLPYPYIEKGVYKLFYYGEKVEVVLHDLTFYQSWPHAPYHPCTILQQNIL